MQLERGKIPPIFQAITDDMCGDRMTPSLSVGDITIAYEKTAGSIKIRVPFATPDQLYYRHTRDTLFISNDLRRFFRPENEIDGRALYALLQFGALIPPLTMWKDVHQLTPGKEVTVNLNTLAVIESATTIQWPCVEDADFTLSNERQREILSEILDAILIQSCPNQDPVILFSGGVDSGLLAAHAAAMGWKNTTLVNYRFGEDDDESDLAERMASHLGLQLVQFDDTDYDPVEILDRVADTFTHPFGDPSTLPTSVFANAVVRHFEPPRVIVDGTGADGAFGLFSSARFYERLYRVPHGLRALLASFYPMCFNRNWVSPIERIARVLRRSVQMPLLAQPIATNSLCGLAYHPGAELRVELFELIRKWMDDAGTSSQNAARLPALDVALSCCRTLAQKDKSIFDASGHQVIYPFLRDHVIGLAVERARYWPGSDEPKKVLKSILTSHVPRGMVYRPKSGFDGPYAAIFAQPGFLQAFDRLVAGDSVFADVLDIPRMKRLRKWIQAGEPVGLQASWFLWTAVFTDCWMTQLNAAHRR